jgi:hypothetical protein
VAARIYGLRNRACALPCHSRANKSHHQELKADRLANLFEQPGYIINLSGCTEKESGGFSQ